MSAASPSQIPPIAVSLGDPAGIGPELIALAWQHFRQNAAPHGDLDKSQDHSGVFFVTGGAQILRQAACARSVQCDIIPISSPAQAADAFAHGIPVLDPEEGLKSTPALAPILDGGDLAYNPGKPDERGAALALQSLADATRCTLLGQASALVSAPVAKSQLVKIGFEFPGQTEFLAQACGLDADAAVMMLAGPSLRTVPITVHCAISDVSELISTELIIKKVEITAYALAHDFGLANPRLAIAGLNPHAGEDGRFGHEEASIITPAIEELAKRGLNVFGPHPGDALFTPRARKTYDAAICMYHDQALIPLKALEFDEGVNVTLGLPIIRTSPDHGTAFDIAGKQIADPGAIIAAINMAQQCAQQRAKNG